MSVRSKLKEYKRVFNITKKPTFEELKNIVKITGLGILAVGLIGFVIFMIMFYLKAKLGITEFV